jgi:hypothetical protein
MFYRSKSFILILTILLNFSFLYADEECPVISTKEIQNAFSADQAILIRSDPGTCMWDINEVDTLVLNTLKRPSVKQASLMFKDYKKVTFSNLTRNVSYPEIGDKALIGFTPKNTDRAIGSMAILKKNDMVTLNYYADDQDNLNDALVTSLETIGRLAIIKAKSIDHHLNKCQWILPKEINKLLGKKGQTIQRLGSEQCIAYTQPGDGSLTIMGDHSINANLYSTMRQKNEEGCRVINLAYLDKTAYAYYNCKKPAKHVINVEILKDDHHMSITYKPTNRAAVKKDIKALKPLLKHIYKNL